MWNLIEYSDNYFKASGSLWQYYRNEPFLNADGAVDNFLLITITVVYLNLKQKQQAEQEMMVEKTLKLNCH